MEQAISTFSTFPQTPKERASFVDKAVNEILSGERNPLEFELMLKNLEDTVNAIRKDDRVKDSIMKEANKYAEKTFEFRGFEITKSDGKRTNDFSNDSTWVELNEKIKVRENILKAVNPSVSDIADGNTGEMLKGPIVKYSKPYLTIKFKG